MATHAQNVSLGFPRAVKYLRRKPGGCGVLRPLAQAHDPEFVPSGSQGKCIVLYIQTRSGTPLPSTPVVECRDLLFNHSSIQQTSVVYGTSEPVKLLSHVRLFAIPWTVPYQAPPSVEFSRQFQYWCGLPFPSPGDLPDPGIEPRFPALKADALPSEPPGKPCLRDCLLLSHFSRVRLCVIP